MKNFPKKLGRVGFFLKGVLERNKRDLKSFLKERGRVQRDMNTLLGQGPTREILLALSSSFCLKPGLSPRIPSISTPAPVEILEVGRKERKEKGRRETVTVRRKKRRGERGEKRGERGGERGGGKEEKKRNIKKTLCKLSGWTKLEEVAERIHQQLQ